MPLIKSTSKKAFGENIAREREAGKPEKQAVAIAYSMKREAARAHNKRPSNTSTQGGIEHHSSHSKKRSNDYHDQVVDPTYVRPSSTKMTRAEHQLNNPEDMEEKGHKL